MRAEGRTHLRRFGRGRVWRQPRDIVRPQSPRTCCAIRQPSGHPSTKHEMRYSRGSRGSMFAQKGAIHGSGQTRSEHRALRIHARRSGSTGHGRRPPEPREGRLLARRLAFAREVRLPVEAAKLITRKQNQVEAQKPVPTSWAPGRGEPVVQPSTGGPQDPVVGVGSSTAGKRGTGYAQTHRNPR